MEGGLWKREWKKRNYKARSPLCSSSPSSRLHFWPRGGKRKEGKKKGTLSPFLSRCRGTFFASQLMGGRSQPRRQICAYFFLSLPRIGEMGGRGPGSRSPPPTYRTTSLAQLSPKVSQHGPFFAVGGKSYCTSPAGGGQHLDRSRKRHRGCPQAPVIVLPFSGKSLSASPSSHIHSGPDRCAVGTNEKGEGDLSHFQRQRQQRLAACSP